jgi:hypothetical protein
LSGRRGRSNRVSEGAEMDTQATKRVLVVANRTAATPRLMDEIRRHADADACEFTLLIPQGG